MVIVAYCSSLFVLLLSSRGTVTGTVLEEK